MIKSEYLPSVCNIHSAHYKGNVDLGRENLRLKNREVVTLYEFCEIISRNSQSNINLLDGYFVGYEIPQISNQFDLLRFGDNYHINIELKSPLSEEDKYNKIITQMRKQHYYMNFLDRETKFYTFVEEDGVYEYDCLLNEIFKIEEKELIKVLSAQIVNFDFEIDKAFVPSNYLISPFNKTEAFLKEEYFLTPDQNKKKKFITDNISENNYQFYCVSADAGTGNTLLVYDIAKYYIEQKKKVLVLHCAILNSGQYILKSEYDWNIISASALKNPKFFDNIVKPDIIIVDEAQRLVRYQYNKLVEYCIENEVNVIFSYDVKQYLRDGETNDVYASLIQTHPEKTAPKQGLTRRIRSNKKLASFIKNMLEIGSSNDNLDYSGVSIEYFNTYEEAREYIFYLEKSKQWKSITFTNSTRTTEPADLLANLCLTNAHHVIGQEFEKVVFAMDKNFKYNDQNKLVVKRNYYSLKGMWYEIVTRAISEIKIVVIDNHELYQTLHKIKMKGND